MRGQFRGEWWTDSGSGGGALVLLVIGAALLFGSGAAELAAAITAALIAFGAVIILTAAGLGAWLVYRARHEQHIMRPSVIITSPDRAPLPPPAAPGAIDGPRPIEQHIHFHGVDAADVAEILRRRERPE